MAEPELRQPVQHHPREPGACISGWGNRPFDWQLGVAVQQEILPRLSVDVAFNRRWWSNFYVTDNQALGPHRLRRVHDHGADAMRSCPRSGQPAHVPEAQRQQPGGRDEQLPDVPARLRRRTYYWQGIDFTANSRMSQRPGAPGWLQHGRRAPRPLRRVGCAARAGDACSPRDGARR